MGKEESGPPRPEKGEKRTRSQKYLLRFCAFPFPARPHSSRAMEAERVAALLREVAGEGGFAFAASAEAAAAGDALAAEAAREMAWEQLHSGPWSEVGAAWRDAYALACLHVARLRARAGDRPAALRALDMGLIMGGSLLRADLEAALARISEEPRGGADLASVPIDEEAQKWREGLDRNRDIADVRPLSPL
jgi:[histone H3]-dimethyl/trimethyl-L-lysine36 demethylase